MADASCPDDWAWTGIIIGSCFLNSGQVIGFSALAVFRHLIALWLGVAEVRSLFSTFPLLNTATMSARDSV
jgi:hypothetical protein